MEPYPMKSKMDTVIMKDRLNELSHTPTAVQEHFLLPPALPLLLIATSVLPLVLDNSTWMQDMYGFDARTETEFHVFQLA